MAHPESPLGAPLPNERSVIVSGRWLMAEIGLYFVFQLNGIEIFIFCGLLTFIVVVFIVLFYH